MKEHISLRICVSQLLGTHITSDMHFLGRGTHITRDMCFLGRIRVSRVGELALFPFFHFRKNRPGKCVSQYSRKKK